MSGSLFHSRPIAALYVETEGAYFGLEGVDPWDKERDARLYAGPHPVIAHPPCSRWCQIAPLVRHVHGYEVGDDGGCFEAALAAVRTYGGVLEHPAYSYAWPRFGLPKPIAELWRAATDDEGWVIEFYQHAYGTPARKATWLYAVGCALPDLRTFGRRPDTPGAGWWIQGRRKTAGSGRMRDAAASRTPESLRDTLIEMARSVYEARAAA